MRKATEEFIKEEKGCLAEMVKLCITSGDMDQESYEITCLLIRLLDTSNDFLLKQADEYDALTREITEIRKQLNRMETKINSK